MTAAPTTISLDGGDFNVKKIGKTRLMILKPGFYVFDYSKEGYISSSSRINVKFLSFQKENIVLKQMYYLGEAPIGSGISASFLTLDKSNNFIYFPETDQAFYKSSISAKTYDLPNKMGDKIEIDLALTETDTINDVRYSPESNQALVFITSEGSKTVIKKCNLLTKEIIVLDENLIDVQWTSETSLVGILTGQKTNLVELDLSGKVTGTLTELDEYAFMVYPSSDTKTFLIQTSRDNKDALLFYNKESATKNFQKIEEGLVIDIKASPVNSDFLILVSTVNTVVPMLVNASAKTALNFTPYLSNLVWSPDGKSIIYLQLDRKNKKYNFESYDFSSQKSTLLRTYSMDEGDPSDMIVSKDNIYMVLNGSIIGFNINGK